MTHQFYIQNGARRSAQCFPISLDRGITVADAIQDFAKMMSISTTQILRLGTIDGLIVLPGQQVPEGTLLLEVERTVFDQLTGAGEVNVLSFWSLSTVWSTVLPSVVIFCMFSGYAILLGGLASASDLCKKDDQSAALFSQLFAWGTNAWGTYNGGGLASTDIENLKFVCGLGISLFWWIISAELVLVIIPAMVLLFRASSCSPGCKAAWSYIITCSINILTALLAYEAFVVVPGSYFASRVSGLPGKYINAIKVLAAGVIVLLTSNFFWILCQASGKMIPDSFKCCLFCSSVGSVLKAPMNQDATPTSPTSGRVKVVVSTNSPMSMVKSA